MGLKKSETEFWLKIGWNELFHRYKGRESPYMIVGIVIIAVFLLFAFLPHIIFEDLSYVISVFLVMLGIVFGLLVGIYLSYLFYIHGVQ